MTYSHGQHVHDEHGECEVNLYGRHIVEAAHYEGE